MFDIVTNFFLLHIKGCIFLLKCKNVFNGLCLDVVGIILHDVMLPYLICCQSLLYDVMLSYLMCCQSLFHDIMFDVCVRYCFMISCYNI